MLKNKRKILNTKNVLAVVLLGIFVFSNFAFAADEIIVKIGELKALNAELSATGSYEAQPKCDSVFAGQLQKLDSDSAWNYAWLMLGSNDNKLTSRWNYSENDPKKRTCLVYERIDIAPTIGDIMKATFGSSVNFSNLTQVQMEYLEGKLGNTPITKVEWATGRPVALARTEYAIQVEQKLLNTAINITKKNFNETIGQKDGEASTVSRIVGWIVNSLINIITSVISIVVAWVGNLLAITIEKNILVSWYPGIVKVGWTIVRDILNMIFIIAMIAMALGTILRIEKYNYKNLLVKVVLMALLINFSYVIAVSLIDFSNMFAKFFYADSHWHSLAFIWQNVAWGGGIDGGVSSIGNSISGLILSIVMLVAFLTLAGMFILRTVGLWMLIILSPAAFGLNVLPATEEYAHKWWGTFTKYLVWAPVALLFLHLAEALLGQLNKVSQDQSSVFNKVIVMAFIWGAVKVAQEAGMVGGDMVMKGAKSVGMLPVGAMKMGGGAIARGYTKWATSKLEEAKGQKKAGAERFWRVAQFANLSVAKKAWDERTKEKEAEAYTQATGDIHDSINRVMPTEWKKGKDGKIQMGQKTFYGRIGQQTMINHKIKTWTEANLSEEEKNEAIQAAHHPEDIEALESVQIKGRHEDGDEISMGLQRRKVREEEIYQELLEGGENKDNARIMAQTRAKDEVEAEFDVIDHLDTTTERLKHAGLSDSEIATRIAHMDEIGEAEQKIRAIGNAVYEYDGRFRTANDLSGYEKMEKEMGTAEMLKALADLDMPNTHKLEETVKDKDGNVVTDADGNVVKKVVAIQFTDKNGKVTGMVKSYDDLQKAIAGTTGKTRKEKRKLREDGTDIRYNIIGARKSDSADKRMKRGDTERWSKGHEPAAYLVQNEEGKFVRFSSFGAKRFSSVDGASVNAFKKTRGVQARVAKIAGIYQDADGKYDIKNFDLDVMAQAMKLNEDFTKAIISKSDLEGPIIDDIIIGLQARGVHIDNPTQFKADVKPTK